LAKSLKRKAFYQGIRSFKRMNHPQKKALRAPTERAKTKSPLRLALLQLRESGAYDALRIRYFGDPAAAS